MKQYKISEQLNLDILERMQEEKPIAVYAKAIVGKLGVILFNPLTGTTEERILKGDPRDPSTNIDDITVKFWTNQALMFFKNMNRRSIEKGYLVPYNPDEVDSEFVSVNAVTDEEIRDILSQPYFTLDNKLKEFTSPVPVERILRIAEEMNRPIGTINRIKERLVELQQTDDTVTLEEHYKNLQV